MFRDKHIFISRREFLRDSAWAAAAAAFAAAFQERIEAKQKSPTAQAQAAPSAAAPDPQSARHLPPVRIGFIGTGTQGQTLLQRLVRVPGVRVVAVCDIYPPHLSRGIQMAGAQATSYRDYRRLLERKDVDAVIIATPLYLHAQMAIDALQAGKHVFCEKMMAYSIEEARRMVQVSRETGKHLQIGHQRRYNPIYAHAREMVTEQDVIGKMVHVRAWWHRNSSWKRPVRDKQYEELLNWRLYSKYSQGLMAELASHQIDVVNWFTGKLPVSVMGMGGIDYWKDGREVWDNVEVIYEYPDGVKVVYTSILSNQYDGYAEQFMGDKGTLLLTNEKDGYLFREPTAEELGWDAKNKTVGKGGVTGIVLDVTATKRRGTGAVIGGQKMAAGYERKDAYELELESFVHDVVRNGQKPLCDAEVGFQATVTILMANKAIAEGTKVTFTPEMFQV
ncbi:MAG: Gfo/Idh/MocA family oxidoreductase [Armatimonadota bacterium]|nr:Gfo/Idh/MocA family oxidoreductase [bacterium]MDW8290173.1 Gfo/Idh/MocA family oxidoreductase [Armatimonadota bacterium]